MASQQSLSPPGTMEAPAVLTSVSLTPRVVDHLLAISPQTSGLARGDGGPDIDSEADSTAGASDTAGVTGGGGRSMSVTAQQLAAMVALVELLGDDTREVCRHTWHAWHTWQRPTAGARRSGSR